jgi:alkylhydroperoxidase family enzyme
VANGNVPDAVHQEVQPHFTATELADLTCVIATINAWNRLSIAARVVPGTYRVRAVAAAQ